VAPCATNSATIAAPIPLALPVTSARLPANNPAITPPVSKQSMKTLAISSTYTGSKAIILGAIRVIISSKFNPIFSPAGFLRISNVTLSL
jgi:hypothetical protein